MASVFISSVIDAPADQVWKRIRDFNGLPTWHPRIAASQIEGGLPADQIGCIRSFRLQNGDQLREQLLGLSDHELFYTYAILDSPMPVENYVATLRLTPVSDGNRSFIEWSAEFDCMAEDEPGLIKTIGENVFQGGFDSLKRHFSR